MRFAVFTHVPHFKNGNHFYAYSPYVREMNLWFAQVANVEIVAPLLEGIPNAISIPYKTDQLIFNRISSFDLLSWKSKFLAIVKIPWVFYKVFQVMLRADHLHIRCPGNVGLIACVAQIFFPKKAKTAKYAGNWDPNAKQPWSYNLQKKILNNTFLTRNIRVLVYGDWPEQSKNITPFFTASFSKMEKGLYNKDSASPYKFIFVGSLSSGKQPLFTIKLIEVLLGKGIPVKFEIYGSGVLKNELQEYITTKNLDPFVRLMGNCKLEELKDVYKSSHFLILASKSEGWPKAVAEAMFFGCIPIVTPVSCVPWMLGEGSRGILAPPFYKREIKEKVWIEDLVNRIVELIKNPGEMRCKSMAAQEWSQEFTLEKFEKGINGTLASFVR